MRKRNTIKKVKQVGEQLYIDAQTGELVPLNVSKPEERDFNFHKVWLGSLVEAFDAISSQKTKVAFWLLLNLNKENQLVFTQEQVASKTGASIQTVNNTFKALMDADLLRKIDGVYIANPEVIFKGTTHARQTAMSNYLKSSKREPSDKEKITMLESKIAQLEKEAKVLRAKTRKVG
jgi:DNA-binding transcriptional regulator YhcF (GntR family)